MIDLLNIGFYLLIFLPGFIFVQVIERHLLREKKPQFEKTIEIVLWSVLIWMISFSIPFWRLFYSERDLLLNEFTKFLATDSQQEKMFNEIKHLVPSVSKFFTLFFFSVCGWVFVLANLWGLIRKQRIVDALFK